MGLFDSVRGVFGGGESGTDGTDLGADVSRDVPRPSHHREPDPTDFQNKAIDAVQEWERLDLDFSVDSLERLEDFAEKEGARLDVLADEGSDDEAVANLHTGFTIRTGSYLGEVLVRRFDGDWERTEAGWAVTVPVGDEAVTVDVFEIAAFSFAEYPMLVETATQLGADLGDEDEADEDATDDEDVRSEFETEAVEFATFWTTYDLDFSPVSIARLDVLVDSEWDDDEFADVEAGAGDMDSKMFTELVKQTGSYYGEVLVRTLDASWTRRDGEVVVTVPAAGGAAAVVERVFDVAEATLSGRGTFADSYEALVDRTDRDAPAIPTQPAQSADEDVAAEFEGGDADPDQPPRDDGAPADTVPDDVDARVIAATEDRPPSSDEPADDRHRARTDGADDGTDGADDGTDGDIEVPTAAEPDLATGRGEPSTTDVGGVEPSDGHPVDDEPAEFDLSEETGGDDGTVGPSDITEDATAFAATWPGYDLDHSVESLARLDALVAEEYEAETVPTVDPTTAAQPDASYIAARVVEAGGYFAEVLRRTLGGAWSGEGSDMVFVVSAREGETQVDPFTVAAAAFRGEDSFADSYERIRHRLSDAV
jgi:hypothetical protein